MQVDPPLEEAIIFEPFAELAALAVETRRAQIGHLVLSASYRNPGLTAKAISTIDVISGGRAILGIGAGWKEDEWLAYGYGFPPAPERLAVLADQLEIITRMLGPGRATWEGTHASVHDAIHEPKGLQQPRIPIVVGGNGPKVTWRLAARFADELNLDTLTPARIEAALPVIRERCRGGRPGARVPGGLRLHLGRGGCRRGRARAAPAIPRLRGPRTVPGDRPGLRPRQGSARDRRRDRRRGGGRAAPRVDRGRRSRGGSRPGPGPGFAPGGA